MTKNTTRNTGEQARPKPQPVGSVTLKDVDEFVEGIDPGLAGEWAEGHLAAQIYAAAMLIGPRQKEIAKLIGRCENDLMPYAKRLQDAETWKDGRVLTAALQEDGSVDLVSMLLEISVAAGSVSRAA